jgi:membrane protease YdiL (CAAX protease family)
VNPALAGVAIVVIVGAIVAGSARNARTAILGLVVALVAAPLLADPPAAPLGLAARLVAAVLAGYLFDRTGGYGTPVLIAAGANLAGMALALTMPRRGSHIPLPR